MKTNNLLKYLKRHGELELLRDLTNQFMYDVPTENVYEDYLASEPVKPQTIEFFNAARAEFNKDLRAHEKSLGQEIRTNSRDVWQ